MSMAGSNGERVDALLMDPELERIQVFTETLSQLQVIRPVEVDTDFEDDSPVPYAIKRFLAFEHSDSELGFYTNPNVLEGPVDRIRFLPRISRVGKQSRHGVFFGDLQLGVGNEVPVAVKPHLDENRKSCLDEYFNTDAVTKIGMNTLVGLGFIMGDREEEPAYSITLLQEGLSTLDSVNWSGFFPDMDSHPGMLNIWRGAAQQAAKLHASGNRSHGDLAGRNTGERGNVPDGEDSVILLDWETAQIGGPVPRDAEVRYSHSHADLSTLVESMCRPSNIEFKAGMGIFFGKTQDWWAGFKAVYLDHYLEDRRNLLEQSNPSSQVTKDVEEELGELVLSLKQDVEMHRDICESILAA